MRTLARFIVGALITLGLGSAARADAWVHEYSEAQDADHLSICTAMVAYSDALFGLRMHGEDLTIDFYFAHDDFSLPHDRVLGRVELGFADRRFAAAAWTGARGSGEGVETSFMFLEPRREDVVDIVQRLRLRSRVELSFPRESFTIGLSGSDRAIRETFECWQTKYTGPGGEPPRNPFSGVSGSNPFE